MVVVGVLRGAVVKRFHLFVLVTRGRVHALVDGDTDADGIVDSQNVHGKGARAIQNDLTQIAGCIGLAFHHHPVVIPGARNPIMAQCPGRRAGWPFEVVLDARSESERITGGWQLRTAGGVHIGNR